jgi:threonine-phosphate decarboxylase
MFKDTKYIEESRSTIHTERSLVYLAMAPCRTIRLYKPAANFMLMKLLKEDLNSSLVAEHCGLRGIMIRRCDDIRCLGNKYICFCFMNPKQNDLMVNTILEIV